MRNTFYILLKKEELFIKKVTKLSVPAVALGLAFGSVGTTAHAETVTIEEGDTLWQIAQDYGIGVDELRGLNDSIDPYNLQIGTEITVSEETNSNDDSVEVFHTVEPGETLWSIANLHADVTLDDLYNWNPDIDPLALQIGAEVRVQPPEDTDDNNQDGEFYTVKAGDTLSEIAAMYEGVTVDELFKWNPDVEEYALQIGTELRVQPADTNPDDDNEADGEFHVIQAGDTLSEIAEMYDGVTLNDLYEWNPDVDPLALQIGSEIRIAPAEDDGDTPTGWHTVEPGETLWSIANLHVNTTLEELYEWNPDVDPYNLQPGMEIRVQAE